MLDLADLHVYLTGSAGAGAGSPAPAGPQIFSSCRLKYRISLSVTRSPRREGSYARHLERANPLIPSLDL